MKIEEQTDREVKTIELLTANVAMLTEALKHQNAVLMVLLNHFNIKMDMPHWQTQEDVEKAVGPKIQACVDLMKRVYGPSETDKS